MKPVESRYGMLTVMEYVSKKGWRCVCDCGNEKYVDSHALRKHHHRSCGCARTRLQGDALRATLQARRIAAGKPPSPYVPAKERLKRIVHTHGAPCWLCRNPSGQHGPMSLCPTCRGEYEQANTRGT